MRSWAIWLGVALSLAVPCLAPSQDLRGSLRTSLTKICSFGNRLAGSTGEERALDWAARQFESLGLKDISQTQFEVATPDPRSTGAAHFLSGFKAVLYPLWPNLISPSTCKLKGARLLDGFKLEGSVVRGQVVLLPFGSGDAWRVAAKLGAAAIVFFDDGKVERAQAELKLTDVPIRVPRFYYPGQADDLIGRVGQPLDLVCRQKWVRSKSANLEATLPGDTDDTVLIAAYADAMSVVPGLNPGAQQGAGLASLLEVAKQLAARPRKRSVRFVVLGAHGLGLRGAREYVATWGNRREIAAGITLDLSTGTRYLGTFARGYFYETRDETKDLVSGLSRYLRAQSDLAGREPLFDTVNNADGRPWKSALPGAFAVDAEPFMLAQLPVVTLGTVDDARWHHDTPKDTLDRVDFDALGIQTESVADLIETLVDAPENPEDPAKRFPSRPAVPNYRALVAGFSTVSGRALIYDPQKSFLPSVPVADAAVVALGRRATFMGVRGDLVEMAADDGAFAFRGLPMVTAYLDADRHPTRLAAFQIGADGNIAAAPARGIMGSDDYPTEFRLATISRSSPLVLFPCQTINLIGITDPQDFRPIDDFEVLDSRSLGTPSRYGIFSRPPLTLDAKSHGDAAIFVETGQRFDLSGRNKEGEVRFVLSGINNADFPALPELASAHELISLNAARMDQFSKYRIFSPGLQKLNAEASDAAEAAAKDAGDLSWRATEAETQRAGGLALRVYPAMRGLAGDVLGGVLFYLFLLIPFSYFAERLVVGSAKLPGQIAWTIGIFAASFAALRLVHPAFEIMPNPWIVFVAFVMAALSLFVGAFIIGKFDSTMKAHVAGSTLPKTADFRRSGVVLAAFLLGIAGMRRRRLRSFLTVLTLTAMTFIVLSFTSLVPDVHVKSFEREAAAPYRGVLLRLPDLGQLPSGSEAAMRREIGAAVMLARRVTVDGGENVESNTLFAEFGRKRAGFRAFLGLDPCEPMLAQGDFVGGGAPQPGEVALPESIAKDLAVRVGDEIRSLGRDWRVSGIFDAKSLGAKRDLDGDGLFPPDFSLSRRVRERSGSGNSAFLNIQRIDPSTCAIMSADDAQELSGVLRSITVQETDIDVSGLMKRLRLNLYAATGAGKIAQFSTAPGAQGTGYGMVLIQLAIAGLVVFNTMVAGVFERKREIGTLSSIGLAPNHVGAMFFAESSVYGVLGAVMGYLVAQTVSKVLVMTGALPSLQLNFSSSSAVISAILVLVVVFLSTIYPARIAVKVATPSAEDPEDAPPEGDVWRVEMPFNVSTSEAPRAIASLGNWLRSHEQYSLGDFVTGNTEIGDEEARSTAWLAPYDLGVSQNVLVLAEPSDAPDTVALSLVISRLSGDRPSWLRSNKRFQEELRKHFLAWNTSGK